MKQRQECTQTEGRGSNFCSPCRCGDGTCFPCEVLVAPRSRPLKRILASTLKAHDIEQQCHCNKLCKGGPACKLCLGRRFHRSMLWHAVDSSLAAACCCWFGLLCSSCCRLLFATAGHFFGEHAGSSLLWRALALMLMCCHEVD